MQVTSYFEPCNLSTGDCKLRWVGLTSGKSNVGKRVGFMDARLNEKKFKLVGGSPSLDFVNSVGGWGVNREKKGSRNYSDTVLRDKLDSYADLVGWANHAGLLGEYERKQLLLLAEKKPKAAALVFKRGLRLRATIYRLFKSVIEDWRAVQADLDYLNEELHVARGNERLTRVEKSFRWNWNRDAEALDHVLWPLALSAAELLASGDLSRLRQCGGEECGWLFLDTSRNRSRQWCDMKDCGNLAKVRRFRRRGQQLHS